MSISVNKKTKNTETTKHQSPLEALTGRPIPVDINYKLFNEGKKQYEQKEQ